jgi:hypothetical protein
MFARPCNTNASAGNEKRAFGAGKIGTKALLVTSSDYWS